MNTAPAHCFSIDARTCPLVPLPLDPRQVRSGDPRTYSRVLWRSPDGLEERGVWEITPGEVSDVELDEMFVVLFGRATVEIENGPVLEIAPGHVGVLTEGARTVWHVHETLRKVYHLKKSA